jgi:hypothetical protein
MSQIDGVVVICGLARSGTTYVGKCLSKAKGVRLINEPLNKDFGVKGVPRWYPYAGGADLENGADTKTLIMNIINLRAIWTHSSPPGYPLLTRLSKRLYGGRSGLVWSALKFRNTFRFPLPTICLKDPFATFAIGHMIKSYNAKVVCLTKHPCALYLSQKRRGQAAHIEDLFAQRTLRNRYAGDISAETWESAMNHIPAGVALLWKIMARAVSCQARELKNLLIVRHEDLCFDPPRVIEAVCAHLSIPYGRRIEKYISDTSRGHQVYGKAGKLHYFKRDSLVLKDAWRGQISPQEEGAIRQVVGDDIHLLYEQW